MKYRYSVSIIALVLCMMGCTETGNTKTESTDLCLNANCPADSSCDPDSGNCINHSIKTCGDGTCSDDESCETCEADCGQCNETELKCGDGTCSSDENCETCENDCGKCSETEHKCGDGTCSDDESCETCENDCGKCSENEHKCGEGTCSDDENCKTCENDCGKCSETELKCGDGTCSDDENCKTCENDCGKCSETELKCSETELKCGDGTCSGDENCETCENDCGQCTVSEPIDVQYTSEFIVSPSLFEEATAGATVDVTTIAAPSVLDPSQMQADPKLRFNINDESKHSLIHGQYSENISFLSDHQTLQLNNAVQTTRYTLSAADISELKQNGFSLLAYGVTPVQIKFSWIDEDIQNDGIDKKNSMKQYINQHYKNGWNLGNYLDTHSEKFKTADPDKWESIYWCKQDATPQLFAGLKDNGFDFVRIPVTWTYHFGEAPHYTIDKIWMDKVKSTVDMALDAGLGVMLNIHHDGKDERFWLNINRALKSDADNREIMAMFTAIWSQIAEAFKDYGSSVLFEATNEIHEGANGTSSIYKENKARYHNVLNQWHQAFVTTVRASGGNNTYRYLTINGISAALETFLESDILIPKDVRQDTERIGIAFHQYNPWDFAGKATTLKWGSDFGGVPKEEVSTWGQEQYHMNQFYKLTDKHPDRAIIIGEYGAVYNGKRYVDYQRYYLEFFTRMATIGGMLPVIWDNNAGTEGYDSFGYIDRSTGSIRPGREPLVNAINYATHTPFTGKTMDDVVSELTSIQDPVENLSE